MKLRIHLRDGLCTENYEDDYTVRLHVFVVLQHRALFWQWE